MKDAAERRAHWEKQVSKWMQSGLTQKDYCKRAGTTYGSFKNWCSQLIDKAFLQAPSFVEATRNHQVMLWFYKFHSRMALVSA